jgi:hypothetical protein
MVMTVNPEYKLIVSILILKKVETTVKMNQEAGREPEMGDNVCFRRLLLLFECWPSRLMLKKMIRIILLFF